VLLSFVHDSFRTDRALKLLSADDGRLYRRMRHRLFPARHRNEDERYERQLSKEREDAVLGRAAATIAHEVRNR